MSKIIKAHEDTEVSVFDFRTIEDAHVVKDSRTRVMGASAADAEAAAEEVCPDPLQELEEMVKNRLFEVERKAEALEKEAYEKGYAQGEKDGFEYGKKNMLIVNEHLERVLTGLQDTPRRVFQDYREWLISVCLTLTKHLLRAELQMNPEAVVSLVSAVMDDAEEAHSLTLFLNPADMETLKKHADFGRLTQREGRTWTFKPDSKLERGGCRLESELQVLDASVETRLGLLEKYLQQHGPTHEDTPSS